MPKYAITLNCNSKKFGQSLFLCLLSVTLLVGCQNATPVFSQLANIGLSPKPDNNHLVITNLDPSLDIKGRCESNFVAIYFRNEGQAWESSEDFFSQKVVCNDNRFMISLPDARILFGLSAHLDQKTIYIRSLGLLGYTDVESLTIIYKIIIKNIVPAISKVCLPASLIIDQDQTFNCLPEITDPDTTNQNLWSLTTNNTCSWMAIDPSTGQLLGIPNDDQVGDCTLEYVVSDGIDSSSSISHQISVQNIQPTLTIATASSIGLGSVIIQSDQDISASDENFGLYSLLPTTIGSPECADNGGLSIDQNSGEITFSPSNGYVGTCYVSVQFDDQNPPLNTISAEFSVAVDTGNFTPTITESCPTTGTEDSSYNCIPDVADLNILDVHTWAIDIANNTCTWLSINPTSGSIDGTPLNDSVGSCTLAFEVTDSSFATSSTKYVNITVTNVAPMLTITDAANINEDVASTTIKIATSVQASDEPFGVYSFLHTSTSGTKCSDNSLNLTVDATTGKIDYQPAANFFGTCNIRVQFDDGNTGIIDDEFAITVDPQYDAPLLESYTCPTNINEDVAYSCSIPPSFTDPDTAETYIWSTDAAHGCSWLVIDPTSGVISGTPNNSHVGSCTLAFVVNDGTSDSDLASMSVTVNNVTPNLTIADAANINEDVASTTIKIATSVQASDEPFGDYSFLHASTTGTKCSDNSLILTVDSTTGKIDYQPAANFFGTCNIRVQFDDGNTGIIDDEFAITVDPQYDPPLLESYTCPTNINEDVAYSCSIPPSFIDPDAAENYTWSTDASHGCSWLIIDPTSGVISGTPNNSYVGSCTLAFVVNDGTSNSDLASMSVTVNNVAPNLTIADAANINEDVASTTIKIATSVQASDEPFGVYSFLHASTSGTKCSDNSLILTVDSTTGKIDYRPAANFFGTCNIRVQFDDRNTGIIDDEFAITVDNVNDPPTIASWPCLSRTLGGQVYYCQPVVLDIDSGIGPLWSAGESDTCLTVGLALDSSSGFVSGVPTVTCLLELDFTDGSGGSDTKGKVISVEPYSNSVTDIKVTGGDLLTEMRMGKAVAIDGDRAVFGAPNDNTSGSNAGAIFFYKYNGTTWVKQQKFSPANNSPGDSFGWSVSISGDLAAAGAPGKDSVYIMRYNGSTWLMEAEFQGDNTSITDFFGISVSIDSSMLAVGASNHDAGALNNSGAAYVFGYNGGTSWSQLARLSPLTKSADDHFGHAIDMHNSHIIVGAPDVESSKGACYIFEFDGTTWIESGPLIASDRSSNDKFGYSVGISNDEAIVGTNSSANEQAYIFSKNTISVWQQRLNIFSDPSGITGDRFGTSVSIDGHIAVVGAPGQGGGLANSGATFTYLFDGQKWSLAAQNKAATPTAGDQFGFAVGISGGSIITGAPYNDIGATNSGAGYIIETNLKPVGHTQIAEKVPSSGARMGASLSVFGDSFIVGLPGKSTDRGAASIYRFVSDEWIVVADLMDPSGGLFDNFGASVGIAGKTAIVGSTGATGNVSNAGAAFIFQKVNKKWLQKQKLFDSTGGTSDEFGTAVAIEGDVIAIGIKTAPRVFIYRYSAGTWNYEDVLVASDAPQAGSRFGRSLAINGNYIVVGDEGKNSYRGAAYVFKYNGTSWIEQAILEDSIDGASSYKFGSALALNEGILVIGSSNFSKIKSGQGAVYIFQETGGSWSQVTRLDGPEPGIKLGTSVSLAQDRIFAGAPDLVNLITAFLSGGGILYDLNQATNVWTPKQILPLGGSAGDVSGTSVGIYGDTLLLGAPNRTEASQSAAGYVIIVDDRN